MTAVLNRLPDTISGVVVAQAPEDLHRISDAGCGGVIWHRQPLAGWPLVVGGSL